MNDNTKRPTTQEIKAATEELQKLICRHPATLQGVIVANLLAMYVAGHDVPGHPEARDRLRAGTLENIIELVMRLIPVIDRAHQQPPQSN